MINLTTNLVDQTELHILDLIDCRSRRKTSNNLIQRILKDEGRNSADINQRKLEKLYCKNKEIIQFIDQSISEINELK